MSPTRPEPRSYGRLELTVGARYRVIQAFRDFDHGAHEIGEEFVYQGYDFHPYDDGHTIFITRADGQPGAIRMGGDPEDQGRILQGFERYVAPA
jgi:hypothetical protein